MSSHRHVSVWLLSTLAAASIGSISSVSGRQAPVASERPLSLTVDFVAVQADGSPVTDLQASEVEIKINDRVRTVRALRRVSTAPAPLVPGAPKAVPAPYGTNDNVAAGRRFILVVDQESFVPGSETMLRGAVEGLIGQLTPADKTMVAALPFSGVKVPFTSDAVRLKLAIDQVTGQGQRGETGSDLACRTRRFLESLDGLLQTQAGRLTPVTVVVFTAGLAAPRRDAPMGIAPGVCELLVTHFQRITTTASAARANFYLMQPDTAGVGPAGARPLQPDVDTFMRVNREGDRGSDNPIEGVESLAGASGGARLPLDGAGTAALLRVARESSSYFEAELEPEPTEVFGRNQPLVVKTSRRGVTVRTRPEIKLVEPLRGVAGADRLTVPALLASPEAVTGLRLRVGGFTVREADGRLRVGVMVEPADPAAVLESVGAILIGPDGRVEGRWFAKDPTERPLLGAMAALPGTYRLRVAAIDKAGRPGAAEETVVAGITPVGPLSLGALMFGVSRPEGIKLRLEFSTEATAIASFDIYAGATNLGLTATLEVSKTADGPPFAILPLALARADDTRVIASGAVPLGALSPGDYVITGVIRLDDGTTGRVTRTLRKVAPAAR